MRSTLRILTATLLLTLATAVAHARIAFVPIETRVRNSSLIVLAKVTAVAESTIDGTKHVKVDLDITSTLKGEAVKKASVDILLSPRRGESPKVDSEYLFFLAPGTDKDSPYVLATPFIMFGVLDPTEAGEVKKAIAAEKSPATQK